MNLETLNALPESEAYDLLQQCCASERWIREMIQARPFASEKQMSFKSKDIWRTGSEQDYLQAFEAHPRIGDVNSLKEKFANTAEKAASEQGLVKQASDDVITQLADKNTEYFEKFGFIFIVFATGKTAAQMLELLIERLPNERSLEIDVAAGEQLKITQLRLENLLKD